MERSLGEETDFETGENRGKENGIPIEAVDAKYEHRLNSDEMKLKMIKPIPIVIKKIHWASFRAVHRA